MEKFPYWGWYVGDGFYMMDYNHGANLLLYVLLITLGVSLLLFGVIVIHFSNQISRPIHKMALIANRVAEVDLNMAAIEVQSKDESAD